MMSFTLLRHLRRLQKNINVKTVAINFVKWFEMFVNVRNYPKFGSRVAKSVYHAVQQ